MRKLSVLSLIAFSLTACGQGTDPLGSLADPSQPLQIGTPVASSAVSGSGFQGFSASHTSFEWTFSSTGQTIAVNAPAAGIVSAIDNTANAASVTVYHSARLSTTLSKLGSITARVGDVVTPGQQIGSLISTVPTLNLTVLADGNPICPLSYLNSDAKAFLSSHSIATNPCP